MCCSQFVTVVVELIPEEDGGFSAIAANLPGAGSQGDTREEAIENARDAITACIESYREDSQAFPLTESFRATSLESEFVIMVFEPDA